MALLFICDTSAIHYNNFLYLLFSICFLNYNENRQMSESQKYFYPQKSRSKSHLGSKVNLKLSVNLWFPLDRFLVDSA